MHIKLIHTCSSLLKQKPINLKGKKHDAQLWLVRQLQDPYVEKAKKEYYRCRSAFKLLEINERYKIFAPGMVIVDCGAAPGSWTQVAVKLTNANGLRDNQPKGSVFAIDKQLFQPVPGANILGNSDFTTSETHGKLRDLLNGRLVDIVMSDMAPNATGIRDIDHEVIITLSYSAFKFALQFSKPGSTFLTKVWDGGRSQQFEEDLLKFYKSVKIVRPQATRNDSNEKYILAREFKGLKTS